MGRVHHNFSNHKFNDDNHESGSKKAKMEGGLIGEIFIYKTDYRGIYYYKVSNLQLRYY